MQRPFRFGVLCEEMTTREAWLAKVRRVEELGYSTLLLRDHFSPGPFGDQFAPLSALMAAAMASSTLRIGSMVFDNDYRHPAVLGKEVATLDVLSGGRFEFGLGAGWMDSEYDQVGIPFDAPGTRIERFEEAIRIFKGLFSGEPLTFIGKHYTIKDFRSFPRPVQQPHPPILIGAGGRRMLRIAAREANIVGLLAGPLNAGLPTPDDPSAYTEASLTRKIEWLREAAGERFHELELSVIAAPVFTDNKRLGAEQTAQRRGWHGVFTEEILHMPTIFIGTVDQVVEQMQERRERFGISYYMTFDRLIEEFAPIVERLSGK